MKIKSPAENARLGMADPLFFAVFELGRSFAVIISHNLVRQGF